MMSNTTVFAGTGVNLLTVYSAQTVKQEDGSRIPIMDALDAEQFAKVYVMLGGNEAREDVDTFISHYSKVIDDLKMKQPQALIYIQSILPVTKNNNYNLSLIHISEPTRQAEISYAVFCLKKKKKKNNIEKKTKK